MKNLKQHSLENLTGGTSCIDIPGVGQDNRPFICSGMCWASLIVLFETGHGLFYDPQNDTSIICFP